MRPILAVAVLVLTAACAHQRPVADASCKYPAYALKVPVGQAFAATPSADPDEGDAGKSASPFYRAMSRALQDRRKSAGAGMGGADEVLALSGGGQHGAFGAGFFLGLSEKQSIPRYGIVTGVSTGALQSTFLFLASSPVPTDRVYPGDFGYSQDGPSTGEPGALKKIKFHADWVSDLAIGYSIREERTLLQKNKGFLGVFGGALVDGSAATLAPLEERLKGFLTEATLRTIADEHESGRRLYAGVTSLEDGEGYAIDLGALAVGITDAETLRRCYARALIASSTEPLGAPPVTIALRILNGEGQFEREIEGLFIDGGARYALFLDDVLRLADEESISVPLDVTAIVNGFLFPRPWVDDKGKPVEKWSILNVGLRSVDILKNQVTQFSLDAVEAPRKHKGQTRIAYIGRPTPNGEAPLSFKLNDVTCADWRAADIANQNPFEFFPRYMRCILEYGRSRGAAESWDSVIIRE